MANIGSKPATKFRGDPAIFGTLVEDHDTHRHLLAELGETQGESEERKVLLAELTYELKAHAAAEEQALWSSVLRKPETTDDGRHAVAEHKKIEDLLNTLAASDMSNGAWMTHFRSLKDEYLHHIREEEQELFASVEKSLTEEDRQHMDRVFKQRKTPEKESAEVTPKKKPAH